MLILLCGFFALIMMANWRLKGPIWAMCAAWLVAIMPIAIGLVNYSYFSTNSLDVILAIFLLSTSYVLGHFFENNNNPRRIFVSESEFSGIKSSSHRAILNLCWIVGLLGGIISLIDFHIHGGAPSANFADLRQEYVSRTGASALTRLASFMTWACLYPYIVAIYFRFQIRPSRFIFYVMPISLFVLSSVATAGRQAEFQILLITVTTDVISRARQTVAHGVHKTRRPSAFILLISISMISYMTLMGIARTDESVSMYRGIILSRLFHCSFPTYLSTAIQSISIDLYGSFVEYIVYFTSGIPLFHIFLHTKLIGTGFGAMDFPLLFRRIQFLTNIDVMRVYNSKLDAMYAQGVLGVGWTTAISSFLMDFGFLGTGAVMFLQGYFGSYYWRRATSDGNIFEIVLAILMVVSACYLPFLPLFSDTNMILLLIFCLIGTAVVRRRQKAQALAMTRFRMRLGPAVSPAG